MKFSPQITRFFTVLIILLSFSTIFALAKAQTLSKEVQKLQKEMKIVSQTTSEQKPLKTSEIKYSANESSGIYPTAVISGTGDSLSFELALTKRKYQELCTSYAFHLSVKKFHKEWECQNATYENGNLVIFTFDRINSSAAYPMNKQLESKRLSDSYEYPNYAVGPVTIQVQTPSDTSKTIEMNEDESSGFKQKYGKTKGKKREYVLTQKDQTYEAIVYVSESSRYAKGDVYYWENSNTNYKKITISIQKHNPEFPDEKIIALLEKVIDAIQPLDEWAVAKLSE